MVFNFLRLVTAVFTLSPDLVESAALRGVFGYLFELTDGAPWNIARYAMIALIHAFQCGSRTIASELVSMGLPARLATYSESDSSVLTAKIVEAFGLLVHILQDGGDESAAEELAALDWAAHTSETAARLAVLFAA
jgi:hypothetical protein